jgi:Mg-chelatase subunit ChlD
MIEAMLMMSCAVIGVVVAAFAMESGRSGRDGGGRSAGPRSGTRPVRPAPLKAASTPRPTARPTTVPQPAPCPTPKVPPVARSPHVAQPQHQSGASRPLGSPGAIRDDLIAIVGFADTAYPILMPTAMSLPGIRERVDQLTSPKYFRGGTTNLADGMERALGMLEKSHGRVRRMLVISDGEPNVGVSLLPELAERAKRSHVSICTIFAGVGNSPLLQSMSDKTKGGWHTTARKMAELAAAIRRAGQGAVGNWRSSKRGIMVICVDMSGSMAGDLSNEPGVSRIEACKAAIHGLLDHHAATYGVKVAA